MCSRCTFSFRTPLQLKAGGVQALTPTPPSDHWALLQVTQRSWSRGGRNPRVLSQGPHAFQRQKLAWNVCPFKSVRYTLQLYQIGLPTQCSSGRGSCRKHSYEWKKNLATIHPDEIALLNKKKLYQKFGFFSNHKNIPRKSLSYVQIEASKLL